VQEPGPSLSLRQHLAILLRQQRATTATTTTVEALVPASGVAYQGAGAILGAARPCEATRGGAGGRRAGERRWPGRGAGVRVTGGLWRRGARAHVKGARPGWAGGGAPARFARLGVGGAVEAVGSELHVTHHPHVLAAEPRPGARAPPGVALAGTPLDGAVSTVLGRGAAAPAIAQHLQRGGGETAPMLPPGRRLEAGGGLAAALPGAPGPPLPVGLPVGCGGRRSGARTLARPVGGTRGALDRNEESKRPLTPRNDTLPACSPVAVARRAARNIPRRCISPRMCRLARQNRLARPKTGLAN